MCKPLTVSEPGVLWVFRLQSRRERNPAHSERAQWPSLHLSRLHPEKLPPLTWVMAGLLDSNCPSAWTRANNKALTIPSGQFLAGDGFSPRGDHGCLLKKTFSIILSASCSPSRRRNRLLIILQNKLYRTYLNPLSPRETNRPDYYTGFHSGVTWHSCCFKPKVSMQWSHHIFQVLDSHSNITDGSVNDLMLLTRKQNVAIFSKLCIVNFWVNTPPLSPDTFFPPYFRWCLCFEWCSWNC